MGAPRKNCGIKPNASADIIGDLSIPRAWKVFGVFPRSDTVPGPEFLTVIPEILDIGGIKHPAQNVLISNGLLDLSRVFKRNTKVGETAYIYIAVEIREPQPATLGFGADWWMQVWINGELSLDTMKYGNGSPSISSGNHLVNVLLHRGNNLIVIRLISGKNGFMLAAGGPTELRQLPAHQLNIPGEPRAERFVLPTREAFLRELDCDRPELEPVKAALEKGDIKSAARAYAALFRQCRFDGQLLTDGTEKYPDPKSDTASADRILAGHLFDGPCTCAEPNGIEWGKSPLGGATRFPMLATMRRAIFNTDEPRYVRWAADHILGYIRAYPIADFAGRRMSEGWVSHFVMAKPWYWCVIWGRLSALARTVNLLRRYPQVTDDELLQILQRMHAEVGFASYDVKVMVDMRHNGGIGLINDLAEALCILKDFRQTPGRRALIAQLTTQYLQEAFYPDGMCIELTIAYSAGCSVRVQRLAYALRESEIIESNRPKLAELVTCLAALADPAWLLPSFGDGYIGMVENYIDENMVHWLGLPWAETVRRQTYEGPLPPFTEWPLAGQEQWCGYYSMRSGWDPLARYMAIDGGPWGTTHQHGDKLSLVVTALGARFIIDPSGTRYASNEPDAFISRQPSGFLHNTVTIDGVDEFMRTCGHPPICESKLPLNNRWESGEGYTLFVGNYSFLPLKPVNWQRRILFAGKDYWFMQDVLTGEKDAVQVEQNFQFDADIKIEFHDNLTIASAPNGAQLVLIPLSGGISPRLTVGDKTPHTTYWPDGSNPTTVLHSEDSNDQCHGRGWTGRGGHKLIPAPAVTYTCEIRLPAILTVAIVPLAPGQILDALPKITLRPAGRHMTWTLPIKNGKLQALTDQETITVRRELL